MVVSWYKYKLTIRKTNEDILFDNAAALNMFLGLKTVTPLQSYFRNICKHKFKKTKMRWRKYKVEKIFLPKWRTGDLKKINYKLKSLNKKVHEEIRRLRV